MKEIIVIAEDKNYKRKPNSLYSKLKQDGIIVKLY